MKQLESRIGKRTDFLKIFIFHKFKFTRKMAMFLAEIPLGNSEKNQLIVIAAGLPKLESFHQNGSIKQ